MLETVQIENYKSIQDLTLELGQVNVFIGENGCGKSNILEAFALAAAATANKLDNEFLESRGVRVTDPKLMRANFLDENTTQPIKIKLQIKDAVDFYFYELNHDNEEYAKWEAKAILNPKVLPKIFKIINEKSPEGMNEENRQNLLKSLALHIFRIELTDLVDYLIFSPENTSLRRFYEEGQIEPLSTNGAGLLKLLKVMAETEKEQLAEIEESLALFGWYQALSIPNQLCFQEDKIQIHDKYINTPFDQRSVNEGFLFVLFYMALLTSKNTPKIFAIDNIDASLNPKLCAKMIEIFVKLCKKYNKQVLLTTHNPAILDGLDLNDEDQKLFVCSRNRKGYSRVKQLTAKDKPKSSTGEALKLSEAMLRGYLGGLPKGF